MQRLERPILYVDFVKLADSVNPKFLNKKGKTQSSVFVGVAFAKLEVDETADSKMPDEVEELNTELACAFHELGYDEFELNESIWGESRRRGDFLGFLGNEFEVFNTEDGRKAIDSLAGKISDLDRVSVARTQLTRAFTKQRQLETGRAA